jgi:hypothetical protein
MAWTCRPRRVDELIVKSLLDIVDDTLSILDDVVGEEPEPRRAFHDEVLKPGPIVETTSRVRRPTNWSSSESVMLFADSSARRLATQAEQVATSFR